MNEGPPRGRVGADRIEVLPGRVCADIDNVADDAGAWGVSRACTLKFPEGPVGGWRESPLRYVDWIGADPGVSAYLGALLETSKSFRSRRGGDR